MTTGVAPSGGGAGAASQTQFQVSLTTTFIARQFVLLGVVATCLLASLFFFNLYNLLEWDDLWNLPNVSLKWFELPAIVVVVYGYTLLGGVLFSLVPSERSFQMFFYTMTAALFITNYDHTTLDWFQRVLVQKGQVGYANAVEVRKLPFIIGVLGGMIYMHYNILADDFTRRMIRRGIPTDEVHRIRPAMVASLLPLLTVCAGAIGVVGLVGGLSSLIFRDHGLFPKAEMVILGVFGVIIGYILLSIIKELYQGDDGSDDAPRERGADE